MSRPGFSDESKAGLLLRDGERCAMQGHPKCKGGRAGYANHRLGRGHGGDARPLVNSPANGCAIEWDCNGFLEDDPQFAEEGRRRGVKVDHSGDDLDSIVRTPFWSVLYGMWVVLRPAGMFLTGDRDFHRDARSARVVGDEIAGFAIVWDAVASVNNPAIQTTGVRA